MSEQIVEFTVPPCFVCRRTASYTCGKCHLIRYCCIEHQKLHWRKSHKYNCGKEPTTNVQFYYGGFGFCFDCLDENVNDANQISYFCDGCQHEFICNTHEVTFGRCQICRASNN